MVHYHTADMQAQPLKPQEEHYFLQHPEAVPGAKGMRAIAAIGVRLDPDYAGIDFSLLPDERILVVEANAAILNHPEAPTGPLAHETRYITTVFDDFDTMLNRATSL
jgi:hypothetical protein